MKKIVSLFILAIAFAACSKPDNNTTTGNNNNNNNNNNNGNPNAMQFIINGLTDATIGKKDSAMMALGIKLEKGTQEKVTLSVTGLPANTSSSFSTESGIPDFGTLLTIRSNNAAQGTYPIKVIGTTANSGSKTYDLTLKIGGSVPSPTIGCAIDVIGNFTRKATCTSYNSTDPAKIDSMANIKDQARITGIGAIYPGTIIIKLNCATKAITVDPQTWDVFSISGTGSFANPDSIYINYTVTSSMYPTQTCTSVFTR